MGRGILVGFGFLVALTWKGFSWARNVVLAAIAWDIIGLTTAAGLLVAVRGSRLLGILSWLNAGVELYAAYLLLQEESLDWFRKQA